VGCVSLLVGLSQETVPTEVGCTVSFIDSEEVIFSLEFVKIDPLNDCISPSLLSITWVEMKLKNRFA
jgi:hypothetical protein